MSIFASFEDRRGQKQLTFLQQTWLELQQEKASTAVQSQTSHGRCKGVTGKHPLHLILIH